MDKKVIGARVKILKGNETQKIPKELFSNGI